MTDINELKEILQKLIHEEEINKSFANIELEVLIRYLGELYSYEKTPMILFTHQDQIPPILKDKIRDLLISFIYPSNQNTKNIELFKSSLVTLNNAFKNYESRSEIFKHNLTTNLNKFVGFYEEFIEIWDRHILEENRFRIIILDTIVSNALNLLDSCERSRVNEFVPYFIKFNRLKLKYLTGNLATYLDWLSRYKGEKGDIDKEDKQFIDGNIKNLIGSLSTNEKKENILKELETIYTDGRIINVLLKQLSQTKKKWKPHDLIEKLRNPDYDEKLIRKLIGTSEHEFVEVKETLPDPNKLMKQIIARVHNGAFYKYEGGVFFLGVVNGTLKIKGIDKEKFENFKDVFENLCKTVEIKPINRLIRIDGEDIGMIIICEKPRLIRFNSKYYVSTGSSVGEASPNEVTKIVNWANSFE